MTSEESISNELAKRLRMCVGALVIVGILHTIFALMVLGSMRAAAQSAATMQPTTQVATTQEAATQPTTQVATTQAAATPPSVDRRVLIEALSLPVAFYVLAVLAGRIPAAASIAGLALYVAVQVFDAITQPGKLAQGIVIKVIIVLALLRAAQAGLEYGRMRRAAISAAKQGPGGNGQT